MIAILVLYLYKCQGLAYRLPSRCLAQTMYGLSDLTLSYSVVYWSILGSWGWVGGALNCSACQFLRCKYSYYSWFHTINVKSADLQNSWECNHWSLQDSFRVSLKRPPPPRSYPLVSASPRLLQGQAPSIFSLVCSLKLLGSWIACRSYNFLAKHMWCYNLTAALLRQSILSVNTLI